MQLKCTIRYKILNYNGEYKTKGLIKSIKMLKYIKQNIKGNGKIVNH